MTSDTAGGSGQPGHQAPHQREPEYSGELTGSDH
jgi:hypothetical protein